MICIIQEIYFNTENRNQHGKYNSADNTEKRQGDGKWLYLAKL